MNFKVALMCLHEKNPHHWAFDQAIISITEKYVLSANLKNYSITFPRFYSILLIFGLLLIMCI